MPDAAYSLHVQNSLEFTSTVIRLRYEALNRPAQIRQLTLADGTQEVLKETPVEGPFDADAYESRRIWATAQDGTQIPISLVGRRDSFGKPAPLYLYGYGAYGHSLDPWFSHARLSLLDRGFIFAIAHVRGGGDLGEAWYRAGKLEHKPNTFNDFIACAEQLLADGYTTSPRLAISGGSAGGLLIGAVLNLRPELFGSAIAEVPFVDVLNTMLNADLPLTVTEYDEWGDPNQPEVHERIRAYAPYENVRPRPIRHCLPWPATTTAACSTGRPPSGSQAACHPHRRQPAAAQDRVRRRSRWHERTLPGAQGRGPGVRLRAQGVRHGLIGPCLPTCGGEQAAPARVIH